MPAVPSVKQAFRMTSWLRPSRIAAKQNRSSSLSRLIARPAWFAVLFLVFQFVEIKHHIALGTQVPFQAIQSNSHDIPVVNTLAARVFANLHPYPMNQVNIFVGQIGGVGAESERMLFSIRLKYPEFYLASGFGRQSFPGATQLSRL